jgi:hypothetical protein
MKMEQTVFRNVGYLTPYAGEQPKRLHTTFRTRWKLEIIEQSICFTTEEHHVKFETFDLSLRIPYAFWFLTSSPVFKYKNPVGSPHIYSFGIWVFSYTGGSTVFFNYSAGGTDRNHSDIDS